VLAAIDKEVFDVMLLQRFAHYCTSREFLMVMYVQLYEKQIVTIVFQKH